MGLLDRIQDQSSVLVDPNAKDTEDGSAKVDPYAKQKNMIHARVIDKLNRQGKSDVDRVEMLQLLEETIAEDVFDIPRMERPKMAVELLNDILGYGPIQELIDNPSYSEIMVNGPNQVYVEYKGKLTLTDIKFRDDAHLMNIIDRIVSLVGRHVDEASPMCDARLKDGSRVNVIIPPISLVGPVLTIRKFGKDPVTAQQLLEWGSMTPKMLNFLEACVKGKLNIIVSGGTG